MKESKHLVLNKQKWDKWATKLDKKGWRNDYLRKAQHNLISLLPIKEGVAFMDIGCGTGWAIGEAAKAVEDKGIFYGVDLSEKMIEKANENYRDKTNTHFIQTNAESVPLEGDMFDIIICTHSFHHYLHPDKALDEMCRLLKKGGKVYILDPTADSLTMKAMDKIIRFFEPEHVKMYSTAEFRDLITRTELKYGDCRVIESHQKVHMGEKIY